MFTATRNWGDTMIAAFAYFVILIFAIPSLLLCLYAAFIYKLISKAKSRFKFLIPPVMALVLCFFQVAMVFAFDYISTAFISLFGNILLLTIATEMAAGIITPLFIFESRTTEKQRTYMIISFAAVLTVLFMQSFASVMGTPSISFGLIGFLSLNLGFDLMKLGKGIFHFVTAILLYLELTILSAIFYAFCYLILVVIKK